ncbi:MAG: bifunctional hydroxymethylpyrimidine kinase/phosphomethylpyrimidine kinase [Pseudomonadota bacterium]
MLLAMTSQTVAGTVGLSAIAPVLHRLGYRVLGLPTVLLTNHAAQPHIAGERLSPPVLLHMIDALEQNGDLDGVTAVLTGYLPSAGHVTVACDLVDRVKARRPEAVFVCDPVLGDDPVGLYIDEDAALTLRDALMQKADVLTPNRFELSWVSGCDVAGADAAVQAARTLPTGRVVVTSVPSPEGLATVEITRTGTRAVVTPKLDGVPHGTGDLLAGLIAAGEPVERATAVVQEIVRASLSQDELAVTAPLTHAP